MSHKCDRQYTHVQVPFVSKNGQRTTVDEGLFDVLTLLKKMGVETQFSCQGDEFGGYICAFTPGFRPVIAKAIELHDAGWLSIQSMNFMDEWCGNGERVFRKFFRQTYRDDLPDQRFAYERTTESAYGDRTVIRWPRDRTRDLHQLLIEIQPYI